MIELLLIDVDGTLSDGKLYYSQSIFKDKTLNEAKAFNVKDGLGLKYWHSLGRKSAIITGKSSDIVMHRAKELDIEFVFMGIKNKGDVVRGLKKKLSLESSNCASIGDDVNDISMFLESSLNFAPRDSSIIVKQKADVVLESIGGDGAVREMIEFILKKENMHEEFINYWK